MKTPPIIQSAAKTKGSRAFPSTRALSHQNASLASRLLVLVALLPSHPVERASGQAKSSQTNAARDQDLSAILHGHHLLLCLEKHCTRQHPKEYVTLLTNKATERIRTTIRSGRNRRRSSEAGLLRSSGRLRGCRRCPAANAPWPIRRPSRTRPRPRPSPPA